MTALERLQTDCPYLLDHFRGRVWALAIHEGSPVVLVRGEPHYYRVPANLNADEVRAINRDIGMDGEAAGLYRQSVLLSLN